VAVLQGGTQTFTATVTGSVNRQVNWTVQEGAAGGVITTNGVYTAPLTQGVFHVIAASQADSTKSITAAVTVPAVSVAISPSMPIVNEDEAQAFTALVNGSINTAVVWSIQEGTAGGAITANGVYTAPSTQGTFHIVATSQADSAKNSTATVTVPPVSVVIAPQSDTLKALGTRTFTATTAAGTPIIAVTWSVQEGTPGGTVDNSGTYTAPSTLGTFHVIATSVPDPNQRAVATVTVVPSGFRAVGPMSSGRKGHVATLLPSGKVLVTGGADASGNALATAELFDPVSGNFTLTGNMTTARLRHTATLLADGKVLVAGGVTAASGGFFCGADFLASAEVFDPASGSFTQVASMGTARAFHSKVRLPTAAVLIVGGLAMGCLSPLGPFDGAGPELFNPATGSFSPVNGSVSDPFASATILGNGKILLAGGLGSGGESDGSASLIDASSLSSSSTGMMVGGREAHTATLLQDGKVLVNGGDLVEPDSVYSIDTFLSSAELYDPVSGMFNQTGSMAIQRFGHTSTLLTNGQVLVAGGDAFGTAELFDPSAGTFTATGSLRTARSGHTATILQDGRVLVVGGIAGAIVSPDPTDSPLATAEIYK